MTEVPRIWSKTTLYPYLVAFRGVLQDLDIPSLLGLLLWVSGFHARNHYV
jgi:hypothetical protein